MISFLTTFAHRLAATQIPAVLPPPGDPEPEEDLLEPFDGPIAKLPTKRADVYRLFGNPGVGKADRKWERANMVVLKNLPGTWNAGAGKLYCHKLAAPYVLETLRRLEAAGQLSMITRIGCWNFRHQRHDPRRPLSDHSWGIALDVNPRDNGARTSEAALAYEPFSPGWCDIWPKGLTRRTVEIFEAVGWRWGDRWRSFRDPMHFSLRQV